MYNCITIHMHIHIICIHIYIYTHIKNTLPLIFQARLGDSLRDFVEVSLPSIYGPACGGVSRRPFRSGPVREVTEVSGYYPLVMSK